MASTTARTVLRQLTRRKPIGELQEEVTNSVSRAPLPGQLKRVLGVVDLTALGIAAIIGAGIFSTIGNAAYHGGPAVSLLFVFTALACGFTALCYAEFAARIPLAGSAYTYAYASFGELVAWVIGWQLIMEYSVGNIAVAISWSDYFTGLLSLYGLDVPGWLSMDWVTASRAARQVQALLGEGHSLAGLAATPELSSVMAAFEAWQAAPRLPGGLRLVCDLPALGIVVAITGLVLVGIRESKRASNLMVLLKIVMLLFVIGLGATFVQPGNWSPFAPNGVVGVLRGVSGVFFAYIGFDAISTTAEECRDPQRDLPRGMIFALLICTVFYILISLVLTGMVSYRLLQVGDPLAFVFGPQGVDLPWVAGVVAIGAVISMAAVLLVFQIGQPRIWMAMSRDGLLPRVFSTIHPRFNTPWFSTILTGLLVALPSLFLNLTEVTDLTSIGTLFAFLVVSGGILVVPGGPPRAGQFRVPYVDGRWLVPPLVLAGVYGLTRLRPEILGALTDPAVPLAPQVPYLVFAVLALALAGVTAARRLSLIPVLGVLSCGYLMAELTLTTWAMFALWTGGGLAIYFGYGRRRSRLAQAARR